MLKEFEKIEYAFQIGDEVYITKIRNLLTSFLINYNDATFDLIFQKYRLQDSDTPMSLSYKLYKTTQYEWLFYLVNNVKNPLVDWLMDSRKLELYVTGKYGNDLYKIHHFFNVKTNKICDEVTEYNMRQITDYPIDIVPVTNYEYEQQLNETHREVFVINPRYVRDVMFEFKKVMDVK